MEEPRLRIFCDETAAGSDRGSVLPGGPGNRCVLSSPQEAATVRLPLRDVFPLLSDALASRRTWLTDFADDEIVISADLFEVLLAYDQCRKKAA